MTMVMVRQSCDFEKDIDGNDDNNDDDDNDDANTT